MITAFTPSGTRYVIERKAGNTLLNGEKVVIDSIAVKEGVFHWVHH
jgi:hypothetical protein